MFVNSQQISIDILLICEVITPHKIIIYTLCFYSILLSISFSQDHSKQAKPSTQNYFLLYNSRTRLHRENIKQNSKLDHTKNFILLDQDITKRIEIRRTIKIKIKDAMMIRYQGTSPKLGTSQGECLYPCTQVSFFDDGGGDEVVG